MIIPYLLESFLVIYVLRTCRDYLFDCLSLWYKNVIKTHFAMKTLKRVNMVMWALKNEGGVTQGLRLALAFGTPWYESFTRGRG